MVPRYAVASALLVGLTGSLFAGDREAPEPVKRAIKGGRDYLHAAYRPGGPGPGGIFGGRPPPGAPRGIVMPRFAGAHDSGVGSSALAGLALLESGAPPADAAV